MKCSTCKYCELVPLYHIYGIITECVCPESNLDPETSKEEDLNGCIHYIEN